MKNVLVTLLLTAFSFTAFAQDRLEIYQDYDLGTEITVMTTVKIDANMEDIYLAGLRNSWVKAVNLQKELISRYAGGLFLHRGFRRAFGRFLGEEGLVTTAALQVLADSATERLRTLQTELAPLE